MGVALTLGGVDFMSFEAPAELPGVGGTQEVVKKEFPGGYITQTALGAFPHDVKWSGYLTGASAFSRQQEIDAMRVAGQPVVLEYGPYSWLGIITAFESKIKHQFLVQYELEFSPTQDLAAASQVGGGVFDVTAMFDGSTGGFGGVVAGLSGLALPAPLAAPAAAFTSAVTGALLGGDGTVIGMGAAGIAAVQSAAAAVSAAAAPLIAGSDATQASPAIDLTNYAANAAAVAASPNLPRDQFIAINPNLFLLAQQYFDSVDDWRLIAAASGITDPQPIGQFIIIIPAEDDPNA